MHRRLRHCCPDIRVRAFVTLGGRGDGGSTELTLFEGEHVLRAGQARIFAVCSRRRAHIVFTHVAPRAQPVQPGDSVFVC